MKQAVDTVQQVVGYYNATKNDYRVLWRRGMHFGYYDRQNRTHTAAVLNMNRKLADLVQIVDHDWVLDAGCGIGGSSLWLAANRGCQTTGISIVPQQIAQAKLSTKRLGLQKLAHFLVADYAKTHLKSRSFTVVWALESILHAEDRQAVLKEAFRLLKPGGRLVIVEYVLEREATTPSERAELDRWLTGWAMPSLLTEKQYKSLVAKAGFVDFAAYDWTEHVQPSFDRLAKLVRLFNTLAPLLKMLGFTNKWRMGNLTASEAQLSLLAKNFWRYKVLVAKKS